MFLIAILLAMLVCGMALAAVSFVAFWIIIVPLVYLIYILPHRLLWRLVMGPSSKNDKRLSAGVCAVLVWVVMAFYGLVVGMLMFSWQLSIRTPPIPNDVDGMPTMHQAQDFLRMLVGTLGFMYGGLILLGIALLVVLSIVSGAWDLVTKGGTRVRRLITRRPTVALTGHYQTGSSSHAG